MSVHTIKGLVAFSCDECSETYEPHVQDSFQSAWDEARALGWRAHKVAWGQYEHQCPACAEHEA